MSFRFETSKMIKGGFAALAMAGGLAFAAPAAATNVIILSGNMTSPLVVNISGAGGGNTFAAPMEFDTIYGGAPIDLVAFCVDVFHHITLGNYTPDLQYTDVNPWDTNYSYASPALTLPEVTQVARLVHFGTAVFNNGGLGQPAKRTQLAAVQSAIWEIVANRNVTLSAGFGQNAGIVAADFNQLVDNLAGANYLNFLGGYGPISSDVTLITPTIYPNATQGTQSFLFAAVPEPATWAMMIGGFGLAGAMLRRRRAGHALAA